jgi:hypothetical protein
MCKYWTIKISNKTSVKKNNDLFGINLIVFFSCHGKSTCQILIDNNLFTDPCGLNIPKHFEIHYRCINKGKNKTNFGFLNKRKLYLEEICSKLFLNCSKSNTLKCIRKIQEDFSCQCPSTICRYGIINKLKRIEIPF